MSVEWFNKKPGEEMMQSQEDESMFLIGDPKYVKTPDLPERPSKTLRILCVIKAPCIAEGHNHPARHYILEGDMHCCECTFHQQFYWYTKAT